LEWVGVDSVDNNNIRCLFQSTDGTRFDIDDLSSGEKSAIALFLSFVEREAKELAGQIEAVVGAVTPLTTVILDEPEIHLHPILQLNVLDYMRRLAHENRAQFIVATQSPTMLDAAQESELYLLSPAGLVPDNQLAPLSSSAERLEAVRELTGGTHLLTRCRPVVFIEGEPDEGPTASDQRLFRLMFPSVAHWALVPFSGCSQVVHAVESLRGGAAEVPGSPVFGIVDGDAAERTDLPEAVLTWDVSMIENLFLDADIIWPVIEPYAAVTGINTQSQLSALIADAAHNYREAEIAKRIRSQIQPVTIRLSGTIDNAEQYAADASTLFATRVEAFRAEGGEERIREKVADIVATNQQLNRFDGKAVLREIYGRCHCADAGLSWNVFLTELARHATGSPRANELAQPTIDRIRFFIPAGIEPALAAAQALGVPVPDDLPAIAASARTNWEYANPTGEAYEGLRHGMFDVARGARAQGGLDQAATIDELALQIAVVP